MTTGVEILEGDLDQQEQINPDPVSVEAQTSTEPVEDWKAKYEQSLVEAEKAKGEFTTWQTQVAPLLEKVQKDEAARIDSMLDQLLGGLNTEPVEETDKEGNKVVTPTPKIAPQQQELMRSLIKDGAAYRQAWPQIETERLSAAALYHAAQVLGEKGTIKELQDTAEELAALGDPKLMEKHAAWMKSIRSKSIVTQRGTIDSPPSAPGSQGGISDYKVLEQKYGEGTATPAEESRFEKMYAERRRQGI